ncbi:ferrous iron transport protein B [candidate division KSB1 bacterium 4484_87]|nr:MAG: ferrous iron transport protein B [candidate division KSB1 bacterium 4484_87]
MKKIINKLQRIRLQRINRRHENSQQIPLLLLIGNPNVGKSTIFNHLTNKYSITANYLFTTLEANTDFIKIKEQKYEIIDSPGIYSLDNPSEEGQQTRNLLFSSREKIIIQIIEASKLEQSLQLTAQLLALKTPMIVVLNMTDELVKHGIRVNAKILSEQLNVPVVETIASEGKGIEDIRRNILNVRAPENVLPYPWIIKQFYQEAYSLLPADVSVPPAIFSLLALGDSYARHWISSHISKEVSVKIANFRNEFQEKHAVNLSIILLNARQVWAQKVLDNVISHRDEITKYGVQKFGELSRHPIYGWFILAIVIMTTYLVVGKFGATVLVVYLDNYIFSPIISYVGSLPLSPFLHRFFVGDYGILTLGLLNAIGTVLPIIGLFFLVLNMLEDTGYLTNLIILTSRVFKKLGLTGKSILPLVLGFGCKTMATLSTKILDTKREKYIAIFLIGLAIPCSSQMSLNMAILSREPVFAFVLVTLTLLLIELIAGLLLNRLLPKGKQSDFIIEIPPIRIPDAKLTLKKTYHRTYWFLKEAVPLFLLGSLVLFILDETDMLVLVEKALSPIVVDWLHLPINFAEAMVMSLARSEAGAVIVMDFAVKGILNARQIIVAVLVLTLFIPCISNVLAIIKELKLKAAIIMISIITITSFFIGGFVNFLLTFFHYGG